MNIEVEQSDSLLRFADDGLSKSLVQWEIDRLRYNRLDSLDMISTPTEDFGETLKYVHLGDYNSKKELPNDSLSFVYYQRSFEMAEKMEDTLLIRYSLRKLVDFLFGNRELEDELTKYLNIYDNYAFLPEERANYLFYRYSLNAHLKQEAQIKGYHEAIGLAGKGGAEYLKGRLYLLLGVNHIFFNKDTDSARIYYLKASDIFKKYNLAISKNAFFGVETNLGLVAFEERDYQTSLFHFKRAEATDFPKNSYLQWSKLYNAMSNTFREVKEYDSAFHYLDKQKSIDRDLEEYKNALAIKEFEEKYDNQKLRADNLEIEQKRLKNRNWLIVASLVLLIGGVFAILLQKNTTKKRLLAEQEAVLKQQRVDNLLKEQELISIDAMIAGQEKERQRVAGELHDDLGSLMATIKLYFDKADVGKDPALKNAQKLLEEAYQKIRSMAHSKNSGVMSDQGLLPAIKKMAQTISGTNALKVTVEDFGLGDRMENSLELSVFRMVQELLANTIKHAGASKVTIQLTQHEDNLNIIVEDNGKGFNRSKRPKGSKGMGLTTIEKRVEHLEGNFTVDSILGKGTSIIIDIPV